MPDQTGWEGDGAGREDAMRILRSNLLVALTDLGRAIVVVTSADAGEGKTTVATGLAEALARAGQRVVLVDLDLRHPTAHHAVRAHRETGVSDVLLDRRPLSECLQYVEVGRGPRGTAGLYFLATGPSVENPTELLGVARLGRMLDGLAAEADIVLIDAPPVLPVADTLVIGRFAAGALLVVEARRTSVRRAQAAKDALTRNQTRILGVVVNKVRRRDGDIRYGYGYGYGSTEPAGSDGP